ncbi:MAG: TonB-dependent receptor [Nitrospirae bacterium]|nr:TonB-dependent receptor [Nitrospirota bacterium]
MGTGPWSVRPVMTHIFKNRRGPTNLRAIFIQGSPQKYSIVKIDGVTLNFLSSNIVDFGSIPVEHIERIEVIKGPASSSWGSSIGGIINIITKSPGNKPKRTLSGSYGEKNTGDYRAEASGGVNNLGYYIYAGNIVSDGLRENTGFDENNLYTKLKLNITEKTNILFTFGYNRGSRGLGRATLPLPPPFNLGLSFSDEFEHLFSTLSLNHSLNHNANLSISLRASQKDLNQIANLETGGVFRNFIERDREFGGSVVLMWGKEDHSVVIGADYDNKEPEDFTDRINYSLILPMPDTVATIDKRFENYAVYLNDTVTIDKLTLVSGIRYDHTNIGTDFVSPSLGIIYKLTDKTLLRLYAVRGFNTPTLQETNGLGFGVTSNPDLSAEKVWSYHAGIETEVSDYIYLKALIFRHDISDVIVIDTTGKLVNQDKQRRQGAEVELRTAAFCNTSLSTGFAYVDADNRTTGALITDYARYTWDIGLRYDDRKSFKAIAKGHYIWWLPAPQTSSEHNAFIWDINLIKKIYRKEPVTAEAFFTAHNIFNASQYTTDLFKNPGRWVEGGLRIKF